MRKARAVSQTGQFEGENRPVQDLMERVVSAIKAGGGHADVAQRSGIASRTLSNLIAGQEPKVSQLLAIASATGVRIEWLATGRGPIHEGATTPHPQSREVGFPEAAGTVLIDRYDARAAAGKASLIADGRVIERIQFDEEWLRVKLRKRPENLALLEAWGDSMEPTIGDGDVLMIDHTVTDIVSGKLYVVDIAGELLVKRIHRRVSGTILIQSDNPRYPPDEVRPDEQHGIRIIGEVVWHAHIV